MVRKPDGLQRQVKTCRQNASGSKRTKLIAVFAAMIHTGLLIAADSLADAHSISRQIKASARFPAPWGCRLLRLFMSPP